MNTRLKIYLTISIGLATLTLLSGCATDGSVYYSSGYYGGGSGWHDPYYYRPWRNGGRVVGAPPPRYRPPQGVRPPQGSRPGRPVNLPSRARPGGGGGRRR
jgi:hypothetical protein